MLILCNRSTNTVLVDVDITVVPQWSTKLSFCVRREVWRHLILTQRNGVWMCNHTRDLQLIWQRILGYWSHTIGSWAWTCLTGDS